MRRSKTKQFLIMFGFLFLTTIWGMVYINYSAVIPVLVEAFKEQRVKIEQLEAVLKEHGLLKP